MIMSKFLLSDKDFESIKARVGKTDRMLEIRKINKNDYCILEYLDNHVFEMGVYTKKEFETIWQMLTTEK